MNGSAPKLPLTGSQSEVPKNFQPKAWIDSCESCMRTQSISVTMTKMLRAAASIRPPKVPSAALPELRSRRKRLISEGVPASGVSGAFRPGVRPADGLGGVGRVTGLSGVISRPYEGRVEV